MSQTKTFLAIKDTTVRKKDDGTGGEGCGLSKHGYVGRYGTAGTARNYSTYIEFALDWSGVKQIVKAELHLNNDEYNDPFGSAGEPGIMAAPGISDAPTVIVRRLTSGFTEGSNVDGHFDSGDFTSPSSTISGSVTKRLSRGADILNVIDITAIVKAWAPSTVVGGGRLTNHGLALLGSTDTVKNVSTWAREHAGGGGASERPQIVLTYELGPTVPNTPTNMAPAGSVASITNFTGDFTDVRPTDTLQSTSIEIYAPDHSGTGTASNDRITCTAHGLKVNDRIFFTSLTGGTGLTLLIPYYVKSVVDSSHFTVSATKGGATTNITADYSALKWAVQAAAVTHKASEAEITGDHFIVPIPDTFIPVKGVTYHWRARYTDQENQTSAWSGLVAFTPTNNAPNAPTVSPANGTSVADLNLQPFSGTYSDPDGDPLQAHQIQLSPFASGDARWDEADGIIWDSGKVFALVGDTSWESLYGGPGILAGTYYWRARVFDSHNAASAWTYAQIILTTDFNPDPTIQPSTTNVALDPHAPWRILIRNLYQADGVTKTTGRGPGQLVAVFDEAKNVGASIVYNSPGELHFTLLKDDEQISVVEPKQTHYAVEFYSGNGWVEKFAGVVWDADATETDVVFKGIDYLALYDTVTDERFDPLKPNKSYTAGGSYYSNKTITAVITDQLNHAKNLTDSWVGFISIGAIASMTELVTIPSTFQPTLSFVASLIDSHRQGTGKRTRIKVVKTTGGTYQVQVVDDPGQIRNELALYYGELVQGYRVIFFGDGWANVENVIARNRAGAKVYYKTISGQPFQPSTSLYGRIATVAVMDGIEDQADLNRRGLQAAIQSAKLGKSIAMGLRVEQLQPLTGWDITDVFPVKIDDGAVNTDNFGSGFWTAMAVAWEATDIGEQSLVLTFMPREDAVAPDPDLIPSRKISPQPEWQIGWVPPDPITDVNTANALRLSLDTGYTMDSGHFMDEAYVLVGGGGNVYYDHSTGNVYELLDDGTWGLIGGPPTVPKPAVLVSSRSVINPDGTAVANVNVNIG